MNLGNLEIADLWFGDTQAKSAYLGSQQVWSGESPTPPSHTDTYFMLADGLVSSMGDITYTNGTSGFWYTYPDARFANVSSEVVEIWCGTALTCIGDCSFNGFSKLSAVHIPDTVVSVGIVPLKDCPIDVFDWTFPTNAVLSVSGSAYFTGTFGGIGLPRGEISAQTLNIDIDKTTDNLIGGMMFTESQFKEIHINGNNVHNFDVIYDGYNATYWLFKSTQSVDHLEVIDFNFPFTSGIINNQTFSGRKALKAILFRKAQVVPTLTSASTVFNGVPTTCKIVVPDALYDTWINSDGWNSIAQEIVKLSEYQE